MRQSMQSLIQMINSYISDRISEVFNPESEEVKADLEKVKELALRFDSELGIVHSED